MASEVELFDKQRAKCFSSVDLSRKGSVDAPIVHLVNLINQQKDFFTTSSCSGRIMVFEQEANCHVQKKGCKWLFTSHDLVHHQDVVGSLSSLQDNAVFKFEPLVLHIQCRSLKHARKLHATAVASGFRNSGITMGSSGKIVTAVRSTHSLEVPLSKGPALLVSHEYIEFLVDCANAKMKENVTRIQRFYETFEAMVLRPKEDHKKKTRKERNETCGDKTLTRCAGNVRAKEQDCVDIITDEESLGTDFLFDDT